MGVEAPGATLAELHDSGQLPSLDPKLACSLFDLVGAARRPINIQEQLALEGKLMKERQVLFEVPRTTGPRRPKEVSSTSEIC